MELATFMSYFVQYHLLNMELLTFQALLVSESEGGDRSENERQLVALLKSAQEEREELLLKQVCSETQDHMLLVFWYRQWRNNVLVTKGVGLAISVNLDNSLFPLEPVW